MSHTVAGRERGGKSTRLFVDPGKGTSRKEAPAMQREVGGAGAAGPDEGREPGGEDSEDGKKHPDVDTLGLQPQITAPFYCPPRCMKSSPLPEGLALTTQSQATFWSLHASFPTSSVREPLDYFTLPAPILSYGIHCPPKPGAATSTWHPPLSLLVDTHPSPEVQKALPISQRAESHSSTDQYGNRRLYYLIKTATFSVGIFVLVLSPTTRF